MMEEHRERKEIRGERERNDVGTNAMGAKKIKQITFLPFRDSDRTTPVS